MWWREREEETLIDEGNFKKANIAIRIDTKMTRRRKLYHQF
jgi:hypothetical protein